MGFNTFRGDNRTFAVILLVPTPDRELRRPAARGGVAGALCCVEPLDLMTSPEYGRPITGVMPMGGLTNIDRTGNSGMPGVIAGRRRLLPHGSGVRVRPVVCARSRARWGDAATEAPDIEAVAQRADVGQARERHALACAMDAARSRRMERRAARHHAARRLLLTLLIRGRLAAPHDDLVLRRTIRRIGLLDHAVFDGDDHCTSGSRASWEDSDRRLAHPDELLARLG